MREVLCGRARTMMEMYNQIPLHKVRVSIVRVTWEENTLDSVDVFCSMTQGSNVYKYYRCIHVMLNLECWVFIRILWQ